MTPQFTLSVFSRLIIEGSHDPRTDCTFCVELNRSSALPHNSIYFALLSFPQVYNSTWTTYPIAVIITRDSTIRARGALIKGGLTLPITKWNHLPHLTCLSHQVVLNPIKKALLKKGPGETNEKVIL